MSARTRVGALVAATACVVSGTMAAGPSSAGPVSAPSAKTVAIVTVPLKPAWKVTKSSQLALADGPMTCKVQQLVRNGNKPATAALVRCSVKGTPKKPIRLTVSVRGRAGARISDTVDFSGGGGGGAGSSGTSYPYALTGPLTQVDLGVSGESPNDSGIASAALSPGGQYVAFWALATNLYPGEAPEV